MDSLDQLHFQVSIVGTWTVKLVTHLDVHKRELDASFKGIEKQLSYIISWIQPQCALGCILLLSLDH